MDVLNSALCCINKVCVKAFHFREICKIDKLGKRVLLCSACWLSKKKALRKS